MICKTKRMLMEVMFDVLHKEQLVSSFESPDSQEKADCPLWFMTVLLLSTHPVILRCHLLYAKESPNSPKEYVIPQVPQSTCW